MRNPPSKGSRFEPAAAQATQAARAALGSAPRTVVGAVTWRPAVADVTPRPPSARRRAGQPEAGFARRS
ncbi:MAG TPA: hypothetical protein VIZ43_24995 [Trebonia sp.]